MFHYILYSLSLTICVSALSLDTDSSDSICSAASTVADGLYDYYESPGIFSSVYWWESGVALGSLLNFQHLCQNNSYEQTIYDGLLAQAGDDYNYEPSSQDGQIGNDDIGAWGLTVIDAAEIGFKDPSKDGHPSWEQQAKNVFDLLYGRWDDQTCNGGLRWQFDENKSGYDYKATIAIANLFQLASRLSRFTGDQTYTDAAETIYDWLEGVGLVNELEFGAEVYDGTSTGDNCTELTQVLWTYNYGTILAGTAYLYNITNEDIWKHRTEQIILGSQILYNNTVLYERACELYDSCNQDQKIFKGIYARFLGLTIDLVPSLKSQISGLIVPSAKGAAQSCSGGSDGNTCGLNWGFGGWDGKNGAAEQVDALEIIQNLRLI